MPQGRSERRCRADRHKCAALHMALLEPFQTPASSDPSVRKSLRHSAPVALRSGLDAHSVARMSRTTSPGGLAKPGRLRVSLLGPPRIERAGEPIEPETRKATALLAYLAVTGRAEGRDRLAALLWPDSDEERAPRA